MKGEVFDQAEVDLGLEETPFEGYQDCKVKAKVLKIIKDKNELDKLDAPAEARII